MSSLFLLRAARRAACRCQSLPVARVSTISTALRKSSVRASGSSFSTSTARQSSGGEETFEEFNERYEKEFETVIDVFELQRNLNNAFSYDLVPSAAVIAASIRAARRLNDFPTAVRVFEALKAKTENNQQYLSYVKELEPLREELGIILAEDLYPEFVPKSKDKPIKTWAP